MRKTSQNLLIWVPAKAYKNAYGKDNSCGPPISIAYIEFNWLPNFVELLMP